MSQPIDRRRMLKLSAGAVTLAGAGLAVAAVPASAAPASATAASGTAAPARRRDRVVLPDVPGMLGDPYANEFWYQYDEVLWFKATPEIKAAYGQLAAALGKDFEVAIVKAYQDQRKAGTYPDSFIAMVRPLKDALTVISTAQLGVIDTFFPHDRHRMISAFVDFGQGVLYDPRRNPGGRTHIMNGNPPVGFHAWHGFVRAMQFLDIDADRWAEVDPLIALSWAVQSTAKPKTDTVAEPLAPEVLRSLRRTWLHKSPEEIDAAYDSFPYPPGI